MTDYRTRLRLIERQRPDRDHERRWALAAAVFLFSVAAGVLLAAAWLWR